MRNDLHHQSEMLHLFALCPLLGASDSVVKAAALGLALLLTLIVSGMAMAPLRKHLSRVITLPAFAIIITTAVTAVQLAMQAFAWQLHQALGVYLPLLASSCLVLALASTPSREESPQRSRISLLTPGWRFFALLLLLAALRELLGAGTLFANMDLLLGSTAADWIVQPFGAHRPLPIALQPAGALLLLGLLIALGNIIASRTRSPGSEQRPPIVSGAKRVRIT